MVRVTNSVAARRRTKKLLKACRGFYGDRKNHLKLSRVALMSALAFNYEHRKLRKREFKNLWVSRIGCASKMHGVSYSKLIHGLKLLGCEINRKWLSELAIHDAPAFASIVEAAKAKLAAV